MICPDTYMARPVAELTYWAAKLVQRAFRFASMTDAERDCAREAMPELVGHFEDTDQEMCRAYRVALVLRAGEVARYFQSLGIDCTEQIVKDDPFMVCCAVGQRLGFVEFEEK